MPQNYILRIGNYSTIGRVSVECRSTGDSRTKDSRETHGRQKTTARAELGYAILKTVHFTAFVPSRYGNKRIAASLGKAYGDRTAIRHPGRDSGRTRPSS